MVVEEAPVRRVLPHAKSIKVLADRELCTDKGTVEVAREPINDKLRTEEGVLKGSKSVGWF